MLLIYNLAMSMHSNVTGELRDFADMPNFAAALLDWRLSLEQRSKLFSSFRSLRALLPKGGEGVWGNLTWAPDDTPEMQIQNVSFGYAQALHACRQDSLRLSCIADRVGCVKLARYGSSNR